jgi:hypothetical protein
MKHSSLFRSCRLESRRGYQFTCSIQQPRSGSELEQGLSVAVSNLFAIVLG